MPETNAIFEHLRKVHAEAAQNPETLRISFDTKAKVKIGAFSRGGVARGQESVAASDHDMHPEAILAPGGILEVDASQLNLFFGTSRDTSDFVADCLEQWWTERQVAYPNIRRLQIDVTFQQEFVTFAEEIVGKGWRGCGVTEHSIKNTSAIRQFL